MPRAGEKVKVTYEGTVDYHDRGVIAVDRPGANRIHHNFSDVTVEVVPPQYEYGATYEDVKGERYIWVGESFGRVSYPWLYISVDGRCLEHRDKNFPHEPVRKVLDPAKVQT